MNHWIVVITNDNLKISLREKVVGFADSKRAVLKSFQPGDLLVFYVSRESLSSTKRVGKFIGFAEVVDQSYQSSAPIWNHGVFPQRIKIRPVSSKSCDIKALLDRLRFIKNKANWGASFLSES
ncbi:MAG: EVE domain-containing protein [Deltaproteobacteria bacterium]|nr:EVE domain-containing protein [Deltaproteobacteria bacterium]